MTEKLNQLNESSASTMLLTSDCKPHASCAQSKIVTPIVLTNNCKQYSSYDSPFPLLEITNEFKNVSTTVPTDNRKQPLTYIPSLLPNGIDTQNRPIVGIDWSRSEIDVYEKGKPIAKFKTLAEAAPHYKGYIWVIESTADSYELQNRQIDLDAIEAYGITPYCSNPKYTARYRNQWDDIAKTDEADAEVIYRIFTETKVTWSRLRPLKERGSDKLREAINKDIRDDRCQNDGKKAIEIAKKFLPPLQDTPENFRQFLYEKGSIKSKNPKNPKPKKPIGRFIMAMLEVRKAGFGWRTARRQIGNYGQGYGCFIRSEYYKWVVNVIFNKQIKELGIKKQMKISYVDRKTKEEKKVHVMSEEENKVNKEIMKEMQKILKWLWRLTDLKA